MAVHTPRTRIIVMSMSGLLLCSSTSIHTQQTASPNPRSASVFGLVQPQAVVWAIAISTADRPVAIRAAAVQFTLPGERIGDSGMKRQAQAAATSMIGSGIQNSQCQFRCSSMSPPTTSPRPPPTPRMADISPMLPATRSAGNSSLAIPNASGKMPPATPWMTRATMSIPSDVDRAASSVPAASVSSVHTSSRCLPYMSPSLPMIAVPTDADSRNPVSSQVTPVSLACRSCCRVGSAGITAELSTAYVTPASDSTARITFGWTRSAPRGPASIQSL